MQQDNNKTGQKCFAEIAKKRTILSSEFFFFVVNYLGLEIFRPNFPWLPTEKRLILLLSTLSTNFWMSMMGTYT
jgi:hypothetical protein